MSGAAAAASAAIGASIAFSGAFSFSGTPTATVVTGTSRNPTQVPTGSRQIRFTNCLMSGTVTVERNLNSGGWVSMAWDGGDLITFTSTSDTIQFRITGASAGESATANAVDEVTGKVIEAVSFIAV